MRILARLCLFVGCLIFAQPVSAAADRKTVAVASLAELAGSAAQSGLTVKMEPGVYRLVDFIPLSSIADRRKKKAFHFIDFSGSGNEFDFSGVTIELDTSLRAALRSPIHTDEFVITGNNNLFKGLTITSKGDGKALGGAVLGVTGQGNTVRDCVIHVEGSAPYGYGDLFGKGGMKHSGVHITGNGTRIIGCKVFNRSFGHAFYLQEDCADCYLENCSAEGVMRRTDEILAETEGMAFDRGFQMVMMNRQGNQQIVPGYMKALSEDGFRTYGQHNNLTLKNCTAKNMRGGFELRTKTAPRVENCTAMGCERGFWVSNGAIVTGCKGDAQFGPLLYVEGDSAQVNVELLATEASQVKVHAVAAIYGSGNHVALSQSGKQAHLPPILVGYGPPSMGENMTPHPEKDTRDLRLRNDTEMPVVIGSKTSQCEIISRGPIKQNAGKGIVIKPP